MNLTLPKSIDAIILVVDNDPSGVNPMTLSWSTPREFIGSAATMGVRKGIFIPPLFLKVAHGEATTDNALAPNALNWSCNLFRGQGHDVKLFDSLYKLCNWIETDGLYDGSFRENDKKMIMFYVERAIDTARNIYSPLDDKIGYFDNFDFNIASSILGSRYNVSIVDTLRALGAKKDIDCRVAYQKLADHNHLSPRDFVNYVADLNNLVEVRNAITVPGRPTGVGDEYRAMMSILNRDCFQRNPDIIFDPAIVERNGLKIIFATGGNNNDLSIRGLLNA